MFHFIRFDREAFFFSLALTPLVWTLSFVYDELQFMYVVNLGPLQIGIGNPFWLEYAESAGDGKVIFFESRRDLIKRGMRPDDESDSE